MVNGIGIHTLIQDLCELILHEGLDSVLPLEHVHFVDELDKCVFIPEIRESLPEIKKHGEISVRNGNTKSKALILCFIQFKTFIRDQVFGDEF